MKFIFKCKKYFKILINFICSSQRVIFFLLYRYECFKNIKKTRRKAKEKQRNDISDIFTSEDMENMSLVSRMYFHMKSTSDIFYSKTLIFM